jgi:hypothetical protein
MMGVRGMAGLLTAYVLLAVFGLAVLSTLVLSGSLKRRADRRQPREVQRDIGYGPVQAPPGAYPPQVPDRQPVLLPPTPRQPAPPPPVVPQAVPPPPVAPQTAPKTTVSNAELRRWARDSGLRVADRGPIPAHVRRAWAKAND